MRRSKIVSPMHFVFATKGRLPLITEDIEQPLHRLLSDQASKMHAIVLAVGGMPDHIHIAVLFPGTESYADFVKRLKGAASRLLKLSGIQVAGDFYWQAGYGAFGFSRSETNKVIAYVRNQKGHHAHRSTWPTLEDTDEESPLVRRTSGEAT